MASALPFSSGLRGAGGCRCELRRIDRIWQGLPQPASWGLGTGGCGRLRSCRQNPDCRGLCPPGTHCHRRGSAGGFTTLACLCFTDVFRAGACRYAVSDPAALATDTHRFEARYLDGLIGRWPEERDLYEQRSPLHHVEQIRCPVIFFQGLKDKVVLPQQTERMADALRRNAIPVEVHTFQEEGHGFRDSAVQVAVLESTERFFRQHLNC